MEAELPGIAVCLPLVLRQAIQLLAARRTESVSDKADMKVHRPAVPPLDPANREEIDQRKQLRAVHVGAVSARRPVALDVFEDGAVEVRLGLRRAGELPEVVDLFSNRHI